MTYNPNFQWKRKTVTISVPTSSLPAGYQVKLVIPKETEMQSDFRDLRFETIDGYGLPHWLETIVSNTATVWVKLKNTVNASTTIDIYMYYGNPYIASSSNGINTFDFFDDFSSNTIGTNWTGDITKASITNGLLTMNSGGVGGSFWIYNTKTMTNSSSFVIESKLRTIDGYGRFGIEDTFIQQAVGDSAYTWYISSTGNNSGGTLTANTWYKHKFTYDGTYLKLYINDSGTATVTRTYTPTILNKRYVLGTASNPAQNSTDFDYISSRKYVTTEPATPTIGGTANNVYWNPQRKAITINTTSATPANYQVKLTIPFAPEMNIDFSDLRFVTKANPPVSLDYWIESFTPGVTADIWVELVDVIGANSSDYIYMHYGNPNLTSAGNGTNTFILFDDFNDGNQSGWTNVTGTWTESNGIRSQTLATAGANKYSYKTMGADTEYIASVKFRSASFGTDGHIGLAIEASASNAYGTTNSNTSPTTKSNTFSEGAGWGSSASTGITLQTNTWYRIDGQRTLNSQKVRIYPVDSTPPAWQASNTYTSLSNPPRVGLFGGWSDAPVDFDDFYVRKYITTEPTFSIGTPESMNSFSYRKTLTINNGSGGALADYQIPITVAYSSHMQSNFNDIRFVDTNGNLLPYWIESKDSSTANVWIKVNLPNYGSSPTGDNIVYMYYGNSSIPSASDINTTFIRVIGSATEQPVKGAWTFNNDALDTSGNGNSGTLVNSPTYTTGKFGNALSFTASSSQYVNVGSSSTLDVAASNADFTYSAWVNVNSYSGYASIISRGLNSSSIYYPLTILFYNNGAIQLTIIGSNPNGTSYPVSSTSIKDNLWHYVLVMRNGSNGYVYIDGVQRSTATVANRTYGSTENTLIGTNYNEIGRAIQSLFNGLIDEPRIYNRALTPVEITDLYNNYGYTTTNYPGRELVRKYTSSEPTYTISAEQTPTNITATSMTITPSEIPCRHNICTVTVSVTWRNDGIVSESFVPNITVDNVPISPAPYSSEVLDAGSSVSRSFTIYGLATGTRNICPYPN